MEPLSDEQRSQYEALRGAVAFSVLPTRSQVEVTGSDRAALLHNLSTNDINKLTSGQECETLFADVQGKAVGYGLVAAHDDSMWLDVAAGQAENLVGHLDRYVISEDVQFTDHSDARATLLVAGPQAETTLSELTPNVPQPVYSHAVDAEMFVRRVPWVGEDCFLLSLPNAECDKVVAALRAAQVVSCDEAVVTAARIEQGFPEYGLDVTSQNLPQELDRDQRMISFTKGCYLGQETVARIDALGRVNWLLRGLKGTETLPATGESIEFEAKEVARVRSSGYSPKTDSPIALAFVRREFADGASWTTEYGAIEVCALPF